MHFISRRSSATAVLFAMSISLTNAGAPGRIEGLVVGVDGRPAAGYRVHLIGSTGTEAGTAVTDASGVYSVRDVAAGEYALAVERQDGGVAPVSRPVRVSSSELRRYDLRLLQAEPEEVEEASESSGGLGAWWAGLSTAAKVWIIVGSVAVVGVTYAAVTDDDNEQEASPSGSSL